MFGFGREKTSVVYGVLYDIGSESVGVAIVESNRENENPQVLFSHRVHMRLSKKDAPMTEQIRSMREALFSASLIVSRDGLQALTEHDKHARISEILITVSAPWSTTIARNVHYAGEKDLKITRSLLDDLVQSAETEMSTHLAEENIDPNTLFEVVEHATVDVRINDYAVAQPLGLLGKDVSLVHVTGVIPKDIITAIEEVQEKIFSGTTLHSHTFLLVLHCVLRDLFKDHEALTLIHVTGESTEFGIVENKTLIESISVPYGLNSLVRSLMKRSDQNPKEIYSELTLYHENGLTDARKKEIDESLKEYLNAVKEKIAVEAQKRRFPRQAFVLAPLSFTPLFRGVLEPVITETLGIKPEVLTLEAGVLGLTTEGEPEDATITIASRFFHKLHGCGEIEPS